MLEILLGCILLSVCLSGTDGFSLTKSETVLSSTGLQTTLECVYDETIEFCNFIRPDGVEICRPGIHEDLVNKPCLDDKSVQVQRVGRKCQVTIPSVDEEHFGEWSCKAMYWDEVIAGSVYLSTFKTGELEFQDVWGTLFLEVDVPQKLSCILTLDESLEDVEGKILVWELSDSSGKREIKTAALESRDARREFESTLTLTPDVEDDGKQLSCSSPITGQEDSVRLEVHQFTPPSVEGTKVEVEEGGVAMFEVKFVAYPAVQSDQVKLAVIDGEENLIQSIYGGNTATGRVSVGEVEYRRRDNLHSLLVFISNVTKEDGDNKYILHIQSSNMEDYTVPLTLLVTEESYPEPPVQVETRPDYFPEVTNPEVTTLEVTTLEANNTLTMDILVGQESVSLYIIIGIIVLCSFLCILYYCTVKKDSKKKRDPELAPMVVQMKEDPEDSTTIPLIQNSKDITGEHDETYKGGLDTVDTDSGNLILETIRETEVKTRMNGDVPKHDQEKGAIEERAKELEALLKSIEDSDMTKSINEVEVEPTLSVQNEVNLDKQEKTLTEEEIKTDVEEPIPACEPTAKDTDVSPVSVVSQVPRVKGNLTARSSIESVNENLDKIITSLQDHIENINTVHQDGNAIGAEEKVELETSVLEIPVQMTRQLNSPDLEKNNGGKEKSFSSQFSQENSEQNQLPPVKQPDIEYQEIEMILSMSPTLKLSQLRINQENSSYNGGLSSPGLVLNTKTDFKPTPEVRVPPVQQVMELKPPKGPRTNPRRKVSSEAQTAAEDQRTAEISTPRTRSNSIDTGTQTPSSSRRFDFEMNSSGSDDSIHAKSKKETLQEEIEKLKKEMEEVKRKVDASSPLPKTQQQLR